MSSLNNIRLVLFFTKGMSLRAWDEIGMLDREVALYRRLRPYLGGIAFVTYGDVGDLEYARQLKGIDILCNEQNLSIEEYANAIPDLHGDYLKTVHVLKTNQIQGADVAVAVKQRYDCRLVTRCGFLWSEFAEREFGKDSQEAKTAHRNEQASFTQADLVVVTTSATRNYVNVGYQVAPEKISVIPNYVPTDRFKPLPHVRPVSGRICCVGRHDPQKNLLALFEAVAGLPVQLVFIGGVGMPGQLEAKARELNLDVELKGNMPNAALPAELNLAEIFVLPSLWEGHPKTILEAMACGRPVIGTDVPGIRELIVHGENGYLCQPDSASIRAAVETLLGNKELQAHLGKKARAFVEEHFSLERILGMELAMLQHVAGA